MKTLIFSICISYFSFLCSVDHSIDFTVAPMNNNIRYSMSTMMVAKHYDDKGKYLVLFKLTISNGDTKRLKFMYGDLKVKNLTSENSTLQIYPQASLIASVAPLPIEIAPGKSLDLELFFEVTKTTGKYSFSGINHKE